MSKQGRPKSALLNYTKLKIRGKAERVARPKTHGLGLLDQSSPNFTRSWGVIGGVNVCIQIAILPSVVECQRTEWRWGMMPILPIRAKIGYRSNVPWAIAKIRSDWSFHPHVYLSWKFGEGRSNTFWDNGLQGQRQEGSNIDTSYSQRTNLLTFFNM